MQSIPSSGDPKREYPIAIRIDQLPGIDDEITFNLTNFQSVE